MQHLSPISIAKFRVLQVVEINFGEEGVRMSYDDRLAATSQNLVLLLYRNNNRKSLQRVGELQYDKAGSILINVFSRLMATVSRSDMIRKPRW